MLLVVGADRVGKDLPGSLSSDHEVVTVPSVTAARVRCRRGGCDAVLLDLELGDPAVVQFVRDLRDGGICSSCVPVVAIADGQPDGPAVPEGLVVDEVVPTPVVERELRAAVRRAVRLGEYEQAIGQLFTACRRNSEPASPASGTSSAPNGNDLGSVRRRADECLRALDACEDRLPVGRLLGT